MPLIATRITHVTLDADRQIEDGGTIRVHNILIANVAGGNRVIVFKRGDGTGDPILQMAVPNNTSSTFEGVWIAKDGLSVDSISANIKVSIAHTAKGA